jgi:hypothetical protein
MGLLANYPWVLGVQLGTNNYFVGEKDGCQGCAQGHQNLLKISLGLPHVSTKG